MKKSLLLVLLLGFIFLFCGCGEQESSYIVKNVGGGIVSTEEKNSDVKDGVMEEIKFSSGTIITAEDNSLDSDLKITVIEEVKSGKEYDDVAGDAKVYLYNITVKSNDGSVPEVTNLEKPFTFSFPSGLLNTQGYCYVGIRYSDNEPWQYTRVTDDTVVVDNIYSIRSANNPLNPISFKLYKLGEENSKGSISWAKIGVFVFGSEIFKTKSVVDKVVTSSSSVIPILNENYEEDLEVNLSLVGSNIDLIDNSVLAVKVIYSNDNETDDKIKVDNAVCKQTITSNKSASGGKYSHSFVVGYLDLESIGNSKINTNFVLNIKGISTSIFPSSFIIEVYNKRFDSKIQSFSYSQPFTINCERKHEAVFTITSDTGSIVNEVDKLYRLDPIFTIATDYELSEADKEVVENSISVSNVDSNIVTKYWNDDGLVICFDNNLASDTTYTISMAKDTEITGVSLVPFENFTFKTAGDAVVTVVPSEDSVFDTTNKLYRLNPTFIVSADCNFSDSDKKIIEDAITVSNATSLLTITNKTWKDNNLEISFNANLLADTSYTISMSEVGNLGGVGIAPFTPFTFKTMKGVALVIASDENSIFDTTNRLYKLQPTFTVTSSFAFDKTTRDAIAKSISVSNVTASKVLKSWNTQGDTLTLSFDEKLSPGTNYTISMANNIGIEGVDVTAFSPLSFNTIGLITFEIESDDANYIDGRKYRLNPTFIVTPSYNFNRSYKEMISKAIVVNNVGSIETNWKGNNLNISFPEYLAAGTNYTISMSDSINIDGVNIEPFSPLSFSTVATVSASVTDDGNVFDIVNNLYKVNPTFIVTLDYTFNKNDKEKIEKAISVSGIEDSKIKKVWNDNSLNISFSENLTADSRYTLSMSNPNIDGMSIETFEPISFNTMKVIVFNVIDTGNIVKGNDYRLNPIFTINTDFDFNQSDVVKIKEAISVSDVEDSNIDKDWSGRSLVISFRENLMSDTTYVLSMSVPDIDGIDITTFDDLSFTTVEPINVAINSDEGNVLVDNLYRLNPTFTINPKLNLNRTNRETFENCISVTNVSDSNINKYWNEDNTLTISFKEPLSKDTQYTISMSAPDIDGVIITPFNDFSFTTIGDVTIQIIIDEDSYSTNAQGVLTTTPTFKVKATYGNETIALTDEEWEVVENAISVTGSPISEFDVDLGYYVDSESSVNETKHFTKNRADENSKATSLNLALADYSHVEHEDYAQFPKQCLHFSLDGGEYSISMESVNIDSISTISAENIDFSIVGSIMGGGASAGGFIGGPSLGEDEEENF